MFYLYFQDPSTAFDGFGEMVDAAFPAAMGECADEVAGGVQVPQHAHFMREGVNIFIKRDAGGGGALPVGDGFVENGVGGFFQFFVPGVVPEGEGFACIAFDAAMDDADVYP